MGERVDAKPGADDDGRNGREVKHVADGNGGDGNRVPFGNGVEGSEDDLEGRPAASSVDEALIPSIYGMRNLMESYKEESAHFLSDQLLRVLPVGSGLPSHFSLRKPPRRT